MAFKLGIRSNFNLRGVHPDLVRVVRRAIEITSVDFAVIEGLRTVKRQRELVAKGASKTMNSRHLSGHAVDLVPMVAGKPVWKMELCGKVAAAMKQAAKEEMVPIEWGGDWSFADGPHFQLTWEAYPALAPE